MSRQRRRKTRRSSAGPPARQQGPALRMGRPGLLGLAAAAALAGGAVGVVVVLSTLSGGDSETPPVGTPVVTTSEGKIKGLATAPVKIVEYSDFQCPFCGAFARTTERLVERDYIAGGKVSLEYRHSPRIGDESVQAAEAAECANDQGKFWEYHDMLFANQSGENKGAFSDAKLKQFATNLGLDRTAFDACLDGHKYESEVLGQLKDGNQRGVKGVPYFFINGQVVEGNQPYATFQKAIDAELAKVKSP